jgi:hypothetical protein
VFLERTKDMENVHNNRPASKQIEHVALNEVVNDDELLIMPIIYLRRTNRWKTWKVMNLHQTLLQKKNYSTTR